MTIKPLNLDHLVERQFPILRTPKDVNTKEIQYERDYRTEDYSRVLVRQDDRSITIEQYALGRFINEGYEGFVSQNDFWKLTASLLFYDNLLYKWPDSQRGYTLCGPKSPLCRLTADSYVRTLRFLKSVRDLDLLLAKRIEEYKGLTLSDKVGREFRDSERFEELTSWLIRITRHVNRPIFLRVLDKAIRGPGSDIQGMPDLLLLNNTELAVAEVKSQNDKLSKVQIDMLDSLAGQLGLEVYVVNCREIEAISESQDKDRFLQEKTNRQASRQSIKDELKQLVGVRIHRNISLEDIHLPSRINIDQYVQIIKLFNRLGYHWITTLLLRSLSAHVDWTATREVPKNTIETVAKDIGFPEHRVPEILLSCQTDIELTRRISKEKDLIDTYFRAKDIEKDNSVDALAEYETLLNAFAGNRNLVERIPSYLLGALARQSLLLERLGRFKECLAKIDEYYDLASTITGWGSPTKQDWASIEKRRERVLRKTLKTNESSTKPKLTEGGV